MTRALKISIVRAQESSRRTWALLIDNGDSGLAIRSRFEVPVRGYDKGCCLENVEFVGSPRDPEVQMQQERQAVTPLAVCHRNKVSRGLTDVAFTCEAAPLRYPSSLAGFVILVVDVWRR